MALLDDLKSESERRMRAELEKQRLQVPTQQPGQEQQHYQSRLLPAMTKILSYLTQLADHLNYIKPDTHPRFTIPGCGNLALQKQFDYRVTADSRERLTRITLQFQCTGRLPLSFKVTPLSMANDLDTVLVEHGLDFSIRDYRDGYQHLVGRHFEVRPKVRVTVQIEADMTNSRISLSFTNFESPSSSRTSCSPEEVTDPFLDDLGNFILRKSDKLTKLEIPDEIRERLRQRMEAEKKEQKPRRGGLLAKLFRGTD